MRRRVLPVVGVLVAITVALAGCTPPATEPTAWQSTVRTVADQASAGDYASALATLDALEAEVTARRDAGELSAEEAAAILDRIATVRADLTSLAPTPTPEPTPEPTTEPTPEEQPSISDDGSSDDQAPANPGDQGPGDNGKGKGPGKDDQGPGNGRGPGKKDG
ncbi:hypothetical protein [Microbacterium sp. Kw_RZR3]|uniref:hypothetical protein n=1 Tax=unclassified Microbacterium TaxID=2609290 RepID=UPI0023DC5250|nr:hypothetical protein [Microbacterium sp. Kw_RZR3]MDF2045186.1 hypothetical protein [Microbacterium sp. Kw_RZR3]